MDCQRFNYRMETIMKINSNLMSLFKDNLMMIALGIGFIALAISIVEPQFLSYSKETISNWAWRVTGVATWIACNIWVKTRDYLNFKNNLVRFILHTTFTVSLVITVILFAGLLLSFVI